ncbi:MAG: AbrB/MazE/SpoVT family DNA-binding domain-containing protein [Nitrospirae bacterium]|uniref:AbrB/MazE/SpoVT family DNA-binding domain-containing protein n=1 Tax=Candidatus Magnetobacterium casense TaxID=1455061 RepID=UPI00058F8C97|nr:AbrB family transcriptional regulator [Candidatus Magnetobacterium casensis]MBF0339309.1 AbrB/MazE/SpoVT family DNA-binding domain-containing protein [Nitrospirota bacterium]
MIKKLTKHGNGLALMIDRDVLESLGISEETPLSISTEGSVLIISPVRDEKRQELFEKALVKTNQKFGRVLKRLAD